MLTIAFADLPDDMQVLIDDLLECDENGPPASFQVTQVAVASLPEVPLDEHDRGTDHARAMDLRETPPIIIADGQFLDGKHRLFRARETGVETLLAIDLSGLVPAHILAWNGMGPIEGAFGPRL